MLTLCRFSPVCTQWAFFDPTQVSTPVRASRMRSMLVPRVSFSRVSECLTKLPVTRTCAIRRAACRLHAPPAVAARSMARQRPLSGRRPRAAMGPSAANRLARAAAS